MGKVRTFVNATSRSDVDDARLSNTPDETFAIVAVITSLVKTKWAMAIAAIFRICFIKAKWDRYSSMFPGNACCVSAAVRAPGSCD